MIRFVPLLLTILLTACGGGHSTAPVTTYGYNKETRKISTPPSIYKVRKGDTLFSISWRYGLDYNQVAKINGIRKPYTIYVGQKLRLKSTAKKQTQPAPASKPAVTKPSATKQATTKPLPKPYKGSSKISWRWPTKGKILSSFSDSDPGRKGIDISGRAGQTVIAAAAGKVVYSGNGLPRYGNLLIIKHNDAYLSAYAHNQSLLVKEGDIVKGGQKIALLGSSGTQRNQLHFEIRRNGKPVDPLRFLPKR